MPKNSAYLARQAARQRALTDEVRRYTIQQCGDFMLLAAAEALASERTGSSASPMPGQQSLTSTPN